MKVAVLSQWLGGEVGGIAEGLGRALQRRGVEVSYVTGSEVGKDWTFPDAPQLRVSRESIDGIGVTRYPYYRSHDMSPLRRLATYGTFSATTTAAAVPQLARADVVLVNSTPGTVAAAAMATRKLRGTPYVLLVQDVWPDSIFASGFLNSRRVRPWAEPPVALFISSSYRLASAVLGISPGMRDLLVGRGADPRTADYVYNWADELAVKAPIAVPERAMGQPLHLMYAGNLGFAQDLGTVLSAIDLLPRDLVRLTFVGGGAAESALRTQVATLGLTNVKFRPSVDRTELLTMMASAHMHVLSLADQELFRITMPSKVQFMLAAGAPILCSAPGEAAQTVAYAGAGLTCNPDDPQKLAAAIKCASALPHRDLVNMGLRGSEFYLNRMSERVGGDRLLGVLEQAAGRSSSTPPGIL